MTPLPGPSDPGPAARVRAGRLLDGFLTTQLLYVAAKLGVADVLADPERYHDQTLADPMEGRAYGRGKAKVYRNQNGSVIINSFAHGSIVYRLQHDAAYIEAQLTSAGDAAPFVLAGLMSHVGGMDPVTRERLCNQAAKLGKVSKTTAAAYGLPAPRPAYSVLVTERDDAPRLPAWQDGLADHLSASRALT